jgi:hypothetical protein
MPLHFSRFSSFLGATIALILFARAVRSSPKLVPVSRENLCVTEGTIEEMPGGRLAVTVSKMRAYLNASTPPMVEAHFTFLGGTANEARLGSGELRRQFGLKLRAADSCNLVYAMWRIDPESRFSCRCRLDGFFHRGLRSQQAEAVIAARQKICKAPSAWLTWRFGN